MTGRIMGQIDARSLCLLVASGTADADFDEGRPFAKQGTCAAFGVLGNN